MLTILSLRSFPFDSPRLFKCCKSDATLTEKEAPVDVKEEAPAQDAITETGSEEKVEEKVEEPAPVEETPEEEPKEEETAEVEEEPKEEEEAAPEENEDETAEKEAVDKSYKCCGVY